MMTTSKATPPDQAQRDAALDPAGSFIVQAPAGSGKTELLVRRLLKLLAVVEAPEEIVAITFTRKAAAEMRQRLLDALEAARDSGEGAPAASETFHLARAALAQDRRMGWTLLDNPTRLRVQTIDAYCAGLCRRIPLAAGQGAAHAAIDDASELYREAARRTLLMLSEASEWQVPLQRLLAHLDNDMSAAERLLIGMLESRDHWLRHVADAKSPKLGKEVLERALCGLIEDHLSALRGQFPARAEPELVALARYAGGNLRLAGDTSPLARWADQASLPGAAVEDAEAWCAVAALLLTREGTPRLRLDKTNGFPSPPRGEAKVEADVWKERMRALLEDLEAADVPWLMLHAVRGLPPAAYGAQRWEALEALLQMLPILAAQLVVVSDEYRKVDHAAVMRAALDALGDEGTPTDLALALDYRLRHILVDEFQDTSHGQFQLLERLTAGWQAGDGRTLFLVGDPMQSIYRFREADVGLFLRAREVGIGGLKPQSIVLRANFRAGSGLVAWINQHFVQMLPAHDNVESGAVAYAPCIGVRPAHVDPAVTVRAIAGDDKAREATEVADLVKTAKRVDPHGSIAILVSSRSHLQAILPCLRAQGVPFAAVDIEPLAECVPVRDLYALTCALLHPADRVAWLSVLRAPWCGLLLVDLEILAGIADRHGWTLGQVLRHRAVWESRLSQSGCRVLERVLPVLLGYPVRRQRASVRRWVESAWCQLGGPATARNAQDLEHASAFFDLLAELEGDSAQLRIDRLRDRLGQLFARASAADAAAVQIMTMHGAKGLEFDTVIVPGLGNAAGKDGQQLLRWLERVRPNGRADLLLATLGEGRKSDDPIYAALTSIDKTRAHHEAGRLLYVAATRARRSLHLVGTLPRADLNANVVPIASSLLARLWPYVQSDAILIDRDGGIKNLRPADSPTIRRLALDWEPPPVPTARVISAAPPVSVSPIEFSWATNTARAVGVAVHAILQRIAAEGLAAWPRGNLQRLESGLRASLRKQSVPDAEVEQGVRLALQALHNVLGDERGRWVLGAHAEAASELRLTGVLGGERVSVALDRTFVAEDGARWIIDFKTGEHQGSDLDEFLEREQVRYGAQMERYARILRLGGETRPIRLALYFPLLPAWREWQSAI